MDRAINKQLSDDFLRHICSIPHGKKIKECLQCGTCSASCPTCHAMDYSPREIVAALRAGLLDRVLGSNTVWLCTSCYNCTVRCPAGIPFTDVMYELKRLGVERGMLPKRDATSVMAKAFVRSVNRHGRNHESELIRRFYLRTRPWKFFGQMGLAWRMLWRGRLALRAHDVRGLEELRKMLEAIENGASQREPSRSGAPEEAA